MKAKLRKLIFVYNADSSLPALALDFAHKLFSPETYPCNLCNLTYGYFTMKKEWKQFIKNLPVKLQFHHRDTFMKQYPSHKKTSLPAIFEESEEGKITEIISAQKINQAKSLKDLEKLVTAEVENLTG